MTDLAAAVTECHFDGDAEEQCADAVDAALRVLQARRQARDSQEAARTTRSPSRSSTS